MNIWRCRVHAHARMCVRARARARTHTHTHIHTQKTTKTKEKASRFHRMSSLCASPPGLGPKSRTVFPQICKELDPQPAVWLMLSLALSLSFSLSACSFWTFFISIFGHNFLPILLFHPPIMSFLLRETFCSFLIWKSLKSKSQRFVFTFILWMFDSTCSKLRGDIFNVSFHILCLCLGVQGYLVVQDSCRAASFSCQVSPKNCWIFRVYLIK